MRACGEFDVRTPAECLTPRSTVLHAIRDISHRVVSDNAPPCLLRNADREPSERCM